MLFFYIVTVFALMAFYHFLKQAKEDEVILKYGLIFMIGGTFGNFFDRVFFQEVVDFFDFYIFGYNFPIFNIADIFLVVGAGLVILESIVEVWREKKYGKN
jgi:signal peptidase II